MLVNTAADNDAMIRPSAERYISHSHGLLATRPPTLSLRWNIFNLATYGGCFVEYGLEATFPTSRTSFSGPSSSAVSVRSRPSTHAESLFQGWSF